MLDMLDCYDWREAFKAASGPDAARPGSSVSIADFTIEDVASVAASDEGVNDESNWLILGTLSDGRIFYLSAGCRCWGRSWVANSMEDMLAGCDYTGWDCRCWGRSWVANSMEDMLAYGVPEDERKRLKL